MERLKSRLGWALAGALGIVLVLALGRATLAGPLDPPGPVGSTMRTIDELLPSWGKTLTSSGGCASQRFTCVLPTAPNPTGEAVLDHETGLVWERVPSSGAVDFLTADATCSAARIGGRYGWRLPTISELMSLHDTTAADSLPAGHPFTKTFATYRWSQTAEPGDAQRVQIMVFNLGGTFNLGSRPRFGFNPAENARAWCVRGAGEASAQQPAEQPAWARTLDATGGCNSARFTCVMSGQAAVLDHETGLVWQRVNGVSTTAASWYQAQLICSLAATGGRQGWRLPLLPELNSLRPLPAGHPFTITDDEFWTASQNYQGSVIISRSQGQGEAYVSPSAVSVLSPYAWCVRGPANDDGAP